MTEADTNYIIQQVKKVFGKLNEYSESAQWELFLSNYDNSPTFLHISGDGKMRNFKEFSSICAEYYNSLQEQKIITIEEKIHVAEQNLVLLGWTGNISAQFRNGDVMNMRNYSVTNVFKKIDSQWKIIHSHESSLPPEIIKKY